MTSKYHSTCVALKLVRSGFTAVKLHPGLKRPVGKNWTEMGVSDAHLAEFTWDRSPSCNVGVMCGEVGAVTVLDFDTKKDEPGYRTAWELLGQDWWERYYWVRTASGGVHVYFWWQPTWGNHKLREKGLDIQGDGSQVVAPGSVLDEGGDYLVMGPDGQPTADQVPVRNVAPPELVAAVEALLEGRRETVSADLGAMPTPEAVASARLERWRGPAARTFFETGNAAPWLQDGSRAVLAVANQLALVSDLDGYVFTPSQALWVMMDNEHCRAVVERRRAGYEAQADWMWKYAVSVAWGNRMTLDDYLEGEDHGQTTEAPRGGEAGRVRTATPPAEDRPVAGYLDLETGRWMEPSLGLAGGDGRSAERPVSPSPGRPGDGHPGVLPGGGDAGPGSGRASEDPLKDLNALVASMAGMTEDQQRGVTAEAVDRLALLNGQGGPLAEAWVLSELKRLTGFTMTDLRRELRERRRVYGAQAREAQRAADGVAVVDSQDYTYVEAQGKLFNQVTGHWVAPQAYFTMHDVPPEQHDATLAAMRKRHVVTFEPQMPWRDGFDVRQHYTVRHRSSNVDALNLWTVPSAKRPCWRYPVSREAIAPWLDILVRAGIPTEEREELYDVFAFKVQQPAVKVNRFLLLGGNQGTGKSTLLQPLNVALGGAHVLYTAHNVLDSDFDPDVSHAVVMVCEEMASQSTHRHQDGRRMYNKMKPYAASPPEELSITLKGMNAQSIPNLLLAIGTTNHRDAMQLEADDRRMFMLWMEGDAEANREWGLALFNWMRDVQWTGPDGWAYTGEELVAGWLLQRDVRTFKPGVGPQRTQWWRDAVEASLPPLDAIVREVLTVYRDDQHLAVVSMQDLLNACRLRAEADGLRTPGARAVHAAMERLGLHWAVRARAAVKVGGKVQRKSIVCFDREMSDSEALKLLVDEVLA